jgi:hypothetical protein
MMRLFFHALPRALTVTVLLLALLLPVAPPVAAQTDRATAIAEPGEQPAQVAINWPGHGDAATALAELPLMRFQGYELPMQLITVRVQPGAAPQLELTQLVTTPWLEPLLPAAPLTPPVLAEEAPVLPAAEPVALPTQPLFILRQGVVAGETIAVVALSPLFADEGQVKLATALQATVHNAALMQETLTAQAASESRTAERAYTTTVLPNNPLAAKDSFKITVQHAGLQRMSGQALATAGLDLATTDPATLSRWRSMGWSGAD